MFAESPMKILALEFSSHRRSVALLDDSRVLSRAEEVGERSAKAFAMIERVLTDANIQRRQIDTIAVGIGPGSYTGIRVAISIAYGWRAALPVRLVGVSSADAIAERLAMNRVAGSALVAIDAHRDELYVGSYEIVPGNWKILSPLQIIASDRLTELGAKHQQVVGWGIKRWFADGGDLPPDGEAIGAIAARAREASFETVLEPIYLRATSFVKAPPPRNFVKSGPVKTK